MTYKYNFEIFLSLIAIGISIIIYNVIIENKLRSNVWVPAGLWISTEVVRFNENTVVVNYIPPNTSTGKEGLKKWRGKFNQFFSSKNCKIIIKLRASNYELRRYAESIQAQCDTGSYPIAGHIATIGGPVGYMKGIPKSILIKQPVGIVTTDLIEF